jgi:tetratricopeptide (TPR) repeat protein
VIRAIIGPMTDDSRLDRAKTLYERAVFEGDHDAVATAERELDWVEADLALARGRLLHARFLADRKEDPRELELFERAAQLYEQLGDIRGSGEAQFWVGIVHQVVRGNLEPAVPYFEQSYELAAKAGDKLTVSYATRHLGFAHAESGDLLAARKMHEESVRLRRELGFTPGVAAGLLALAEVAHRDGRTEDAHRLLDEADAVAESSGAEGIRKWITQARAELT